MTFHSMHHVTARKQHRCAHCSVPIEVGTRHRKVAQVWDGDFGAYREHEECHVAWNELNFSREMRDLGYGEAAPFLKEDDHEDGDRQWMRETHPLVARRLGWA